MSDAKHGQNSAPLFHLLSSSDLNHAWLKSILQRAEILEPVARGEKICRVLDGALLGNLFFEPSTRSRVSFGAAFARLGGKVLDTAGAAVTSLSKGESLEDTARVISGYVDVIVLRHPATGAARRFATRSLVPVINAGDGDGEHPTQSLIDLYTIIKELKRKNKTIGGSRISIVGDLRNGRTAHSLILALAHYDRVTITLLSHEALRMPLEYIERVRPLGLNIVEATSIGEALRGADVIYMTRLQTERQDLTTAGSAASYIFKLTKSVIERYSAEDVIIMHPLPRDSQLNELPKELDTLENLAIFRQTDNGVPIRMSLFCSVLHADVSASDIQANSQWAHRKSI